MQSKNGRYVSITFIPDLEASRDLLCGIDIVTPYRDWKVTGVKDVNENDEYVVVYDLQWIGDAVVKAVEGRVTLALFDDEVDALISNLRDDAREPGILEPPRPPALPDIRR